MDVILDKTLSNCNYLVLCGIIVKTAKEIKMKPVMLFAIVVLAAIIIVSSFGLQLAPNPAINIASDATANALYVCPAASTFWDSFANAMQPFNRYLIIALFFIVILLGFSWGWALYQNLLQDSFKRESFSKPWQMTKFSFWICVIILLFAMTPNYFRTVHVDGLAGEWVLCESNTPGVIAVRADTVHN